MLRKDARITESFQFQGAFKGTKKHHSSVVVMVVPNDVGHGRFGFIVSSKVGNSVVRGRILRKLREVARPLVDTIGGFDVVVLAKPAIVTEFDAKLITKFIKDTAKRASEGR